MKSLRILKPCLSLVFAFALFGCSTTVKERPEEPQPLQLGNHAFPISTAVPEAQAAFNRGLTLAYAFSHMAAEDEFREAAKLDPRAPMPWWGVALVNGPHINFPLVPEDKARVAWEALSKAVALKAGGNKLEQELIEALQFRYASPQPEDRSELDRRYAAAMQRVYASNSSNADVAALYAESLMDLHPWDLYTNAGKPKPWAGNIVRTIEKSLALNPLHPGALHFYIHALEASTHPAKAEKSADTLRHLVPSAGHLVHMPAHIYIRTGRIEDAALTNEDAVRADEAFRSHYPRPGFYGLYMLHNHHFLTFARMMQGRREAALTAAREMIAGIPPDFLEQFAPIADGYLAIVPEVLVRFGQWEEVLKQPEPGARHLIARALWRFSRATALTALDRHDDADRERQAFLQAVEQVPLEATFGNNNAHALLKIAGHVLNGEMAARRKRFGPAVRELRMAVKLEDALKYDEPPDWIIPVRHTLGITLLAAGKPKEAESAYREDLVRFPRNGWSLYGLSRALELQGREEDAAAAKRDFDAAWSGADTAIEASCMCQHGV